MDIRYCLDGQVAVLIFHTRVRMCKELLRMAEFYESPKFAGKYFTLDEYKAWYMKERNAKKFTYYTDWAGYNIPAYVLRDFAQMFPTFDLTTIEAQLCVEVLTNSKLQYIIAVHRQYDMTTLLHEFAHAAYFVDNDYSREVDKLLSEVEPSIKEKMYGKLEKLGYTESVFDDELQAYAVSDERKGPIAQKICDLFEDMFGKELRGEFGGN